MAYTIISQNNNTTTLTDGVNTITVPSRVNLTSGNFTIVEVNNNMATLEDGDGNVYRDIPCVATLVDAGGGGSSLPDQTGHSGEFLTTDGTDASWGAISALQNTATGTDSLTILGTATASVEALNIGTGSKATSNYALAIGNDAKATGQFSVAFGRLAEASGEASKVIGGGQATAQRALVVGNGQATGVGSTQIGCYYQTNSDPNTVKFANANGNYEMMSADGTIPTARFTTDPVSDGTYVPTLTIASGVATRSWSAPSGGLPSQTGNSGKFLTTDGTDASWANALTNNINSIYSIALASGATASSNGSAIGYNCNASGGFAGGSGSRSKNGAGIGIEAKATGSGSIAMGRKVTASGASSIQLGDGNVLGGATNSDANTFKVANANGNFEIMSADGTIPTARLTKVNSTITLTAADWSSNTQTVTVSGMTATGVVLVSPDPTDQSAYTSAGILCTAQAADSLTFTCSTTPTGDIDVVVVML